MKRIHRMTLFNGPRVRMSIRYCGADTGYVRQHAWGVWSDTTPVAYLQVLGRARSRRAAMTELSAWLARPLELRELVARALT